jgi:cell division protein FtsI/penicillin-binding protein 2
MKKKQNKLEETIEKRYNILTMIIILLLLFLFGYLFYIQIVQKEKYTILLEENMINTYEGSTAPRGRIYDRNGKLLVDNEPVKVIYYKKTNLSGTKEIELAYEILNHIDIDASKLTDRMIRDFWITKYKEEANKKITTEEWNELSLRKTTASKIEDLKRNRITEAEINELTELDKKAAYLYYLMNQGYSYLEKTIKNEGVTDEEYAYIATNASNLSGFNVRLDWNRTYPYNDTFKSILGTVKEIPTNLKEEYLKKGYTLDDRVGISYLEYQYDDYLRGTKDVFEKQNGKDVLIEEGTRGNDVYLTIDIDLQQKIDEILESELKKAKKEKNTKYYNKSYVVVVKPQTGEILAMSGKMIQETDDEYRIYDYTPGVFTSSVTVGSVIKGASHIVGYNTGALTIGETRNDTCVKLAATPLKCSWKSLGTLNDITALKYSSNTYQFYTAMKVSGYKYQYNGVFPLNEDAFKTYRTTFNEFGLGVLTGIDLPNETNGIVGNHDTAGLLLDFSIGQYDTYTPLQLAQYISTIANSGSRVQLHLLNKVVSSKDEREIMNYEVTTLNTVSTEEKYIKRVQEGFEEVLKIGGTGYGYIDLKYKPAGKTGTSQSFVDSNGDGIVDKETLTHTFVAYAPTTSPEVAFVIVSPDVYYEESGTYTTSVNKRIAKKVSDAYFELYS